MNERLWCIEGIVMKEPTKKQIKKAVSANLPSTESQSDIQNLEMLKIRLEFSWKWFEMHASQRMSLFNFFLIITGILANAYAMAISNKINVLALAVCIIGFVQSIGFITFDIRSRQLTEYGEDIMEKLERDVIFPDNFMHPNVNKGKPLGLLRRDSDNKMREGQKGNISFYLNRIKKMKFWIRLVQLLVSAIFLTGLVSQLVLLLK